MENKKDSKDYKGEDTSYTNKKEGEMARRRGIFPFRELKSQKVFSIILVIAGLLLMFISVPFIVIKVGVLVIVSGVLGIVLFFVGLFYFLDAFFN